MYRAAARQLHHQPSLAFRYALISRRFSATRCRRNSGGPTKLTNIFEGGPAPPVQVRRITGQGIELEDGLILPSSCIFVDGNVFLWNVPRTRWDGWTKEMFEVFEAIVPKPEILILGTGETVSLPPPSVKSYLNKLGIQLDVQDTWNACTTYNLLTEEGRFVAAALLPTSPRTWKETS